MSSARVLSTAELGAIRYAKADEEQRFPVEITIKDKSSRLSSPATKTSAGAVSVSVAPAADPDGEYVAELVPTPRGELRAIVSVPPGPLTYSISRGRAEVAAGGLEVHPPDGPVRNTKLASKLTMREPSGAKQKDIQKEPRDRDGKPDGLWDVDFIYAEETWSVREMWVEVVGQDPVSMKPAFDQASFAATVPLPARVARYRFRVAMREPCRPDAGPFTRLGWDPAACNSKGLATWELGVAVNDLGMGAVAGSGIMTHKKKVHDDLVDDSRRDARKPGDTITSSVHVKNAAARLDAKPHDGAKDGEPSEQPSEGRPITGNTHSSSGSPPTSGTPSSGNSSTAKEKSAATQNQGDGNEGGGASGQTGAGSSADTSGSKSGCIWLVPVIGIGIIAILAAIVTRKCDAGDGPIDVDDDTPKKLKQLPSSLSYFRHATSQGF